MRHVSICFRFSSKCLWKKTAEIYWKGKLYNSNSPNALLHTSTYIFKNYTCTSNERPRVARQRKSPERPPQRQNEVQWTMGKNILYLHFNIKEHKKLCVYCRKSDYYHLTSWSESHKTWKIIQYSIHWAFRHSPVFLNTVLEFTQPLKDQKAYLAGITQHSNLPVPLHCRGMHSEWHTL